MDEPLKMKRLFYGQQQRKDDDRHNNLLTKSPVFEGFNEHIDFLKMCLIRLKLFKLHLKIDIYLK